MYFILNEQHLRPEENKPKSHCTWTELLGVYVRALIRDLQVLVVYSGFILFGFCAPSLVEMTYLHNLRDFHLRCAQYAMEESRQHFLSLCLL